MAGDGKKTDHSRDLKTYLRQPSTWMGLLKVLLGGAMIAKGVDPTAAAAVVGALGVADVVRNEKTG